MAILAGKPANDETWMKAMDEATKVMMEKKGELRLLCNPCKKKRPEDYCKGCLNRRGDFKAMSVGLSYGGGQTVGLLIVYLATFFVYLFIYA